MERKHLCFLVFINICYCGLVYLSPLVRRLFYLAAGIMCVNCAGMYLRRMSQAASLTSVCDAGSCYARGDPEHNWNPVVAVNQINIPE